MAKGYQVWRERKHSRWCAYNRKQEAKTNQRNGFKLWCTLFMRAISCFFDVDCISSTIYSLKVKICYEVRIPNIPFGMFDKIFAVMKSANRSGSRDGENCHWHERARENEHFLWCIYIYIRVQLMSTFEWLHMNIPPYVRVSKLVTHSRSMNPISTVLTYLEFTKCVIHNNQLYVLLHFEQMTHAVEVLNQQKA